MVNNPYSTATMTKTVSTTKLLAATLALYAAGGVALAVAPVSFISANGKVACSESDGGYKIDIAGKTEQINRKNGKVTQKADYCTITTKKKPSKLVEFSCVETGKQKGLVKKSKQITCPSGTQCVSGACTTSSESKPSVKELQQKTSGSFVDGKQLNDGASFTTSTPTSGLPDLIIENIRVLERYSVTSSYYGFPASPFGLGVGESNEGIRRFDFVISVKNIGTAPAIALENPQCSGCKIVGQFDASVSPENNNEGFKVYHSQFIGDWFIKNDNTVGYVLDRIQTSRIEPGESVQVLHTVSSAELYGYDRYGHATREVTEPYFTYNINYVDASSSYLQNVISELNMKNNAYTIPNILLVATSTRQ